MITALTRLPTLFLSHGAGPAHALDYTGSPLSALDKNSKSATFLRSLPQRLEEYTSLSSIRAFLVISAHWEEREFTIDYQNDSPSTKLVYDYYGFDKKAYAPYLTYPVPTDLTVADRVFQLLQQQKIPVSKKNRGFDHGTFMPLLVAFPEAKIPVVQLSLKAGLSPSEHFRLGEILRPLREEGILIIGSGQITDNLGAMDFSGRIDPRAVEFIDTIYNAVTSIRTREDYQRVKQLFSNETKKIPHFDFMHPRTEHFIPFLVALGAGINPPANSNDETVGQVPLLQAHRLHAEIVAGLIGVDSYLFL